MAKLFIEDLKISGKKVLMRVDFNVPLMSDGSIADSTRIEAALPSIKYVLAQGGALILMSHLGRPNNMPDPELSLKPCAQFLSAVLGIPVTLAPDCVGSKVRGLVEQIKPGQVLLLENLRFHRAEEFPEEDSGFAEELASFGDLYIDDAFGTAHRKHASVYAVPKLFPGKAAAGYLLANEVKYLRQALGEAKRPLCALIGGAKVSSKIGVLKTLVRKVDVLLIGGAMSFTFLKALGKNVGNSLCETDLVPVAKEIMGLAKQRGIPFVLPVDVACAEEQSEDATQQIVEMGKGIPDSLQGLDIGPQTIKLFSKYLNDAETILWNGPVGAFEIEAFGKGTEAIAKVLAASKGVTIVAGGDTIAAVREYELADQMKHLSTGGGATLEFIEKGTLPGIEALSDLVDST